MQINQVAAARSQSWIASGWELYRKDQGLWVAMAAIYLAIALVLQEIPFIGYLMLVLITPLVGAGAIVTADSLANNTFEAQSPLTPLEQIKQLARQAVRRLTRVLVDSERNLPVMVVATLTLGAMVVIQILAQLLKVGGAAIPAMISGSVGPSIWLPALLFLTVIWILKLMLIVIALLATHLIVLKHESPLVAMETGIRAAGKNVVALSVVGGAFLVPLGLAHYLSAPYSYVAVFAIGLVTLPLFVTSSYAAYKEMFGQ